MWDGSLRKKVIVAMSGGVDSSVTAAILKQDGYAPVGVTLKLWSDHSYCCSTDDVHDAKRVAALLDIPHYVVDLSRKFTQEVLEPSIREYSVGRTPNPCVVCNLRLKFRFLSGKAPELGAEYFATGHYARVEWDDSRNRFILRKGEDPQKEQSYWLAMVPQSYFSRTILPLGRFLKNDIRKLAERLSLKVAWKKESQDVCWLGNMQRFMSHLVEPEPGPVIDTDGRMIGTHKGIQFYTVGQRRGLGISSSKPLYVVAIRGSSNTLVVGEEAELYSSTFVGVDPNWLGIEELDEELEVGVKIRYRSPPAQAMVSSNGNGVTVKFREAQRAVTPGQLAVFYRGDEVLGAVWIDRVRK
jgi:tRNA-specific 2-thiouridylase